MTNDPIPEEFADLDPWELVPAGWEGNGSDPSSGPDAFFNGRAFVGPLLAEWLRTRWPTATGGKQLYAFRNGIYRPAEDFLRHQITEQLEKRWKPRHADEVISHLLQSSEALWSPRRSIGSLCATGSSASQTGP